MKAEIRPLSELNEQATEVLVREMGIVDALRFLNQFSTGTGNYTQQREQWLGNLSLDEITSQIKSRREQHA